MKYFLLPVLSFLLIISAKAADKDSTTNYDLPDSVKAVQFMAEINVLDIKTKKEVFAGIKTHMVTLVLESDKKEKEIVFEFPKSARVMVTGIGVNANEKGELEWKYDWSSNETYKLLIATASDSAGNFSVYTGYVFLPKENKWKMIGSCKISGSWNSIQKPATFFSSGKNNLLQVNTGQVWCQRQNGSWKNMSVRTPSEKNETLPNPMINLFGHMDSVQQRQIDNKIIEDAIASGKTDAKAISEGVYYKMIKEGTGRQVSVNDTVTAYYKVTLFNDTSIIDQAKDKPAVFPLKRLIRGWQIGLPLCRVGGKIKLVIPSDLAYSIRTRSAKIPPNSILEFEIEVLEAKSP